MISVVIITKNEAHILAKTLKAVSILTSDIVIGDTGSTDNTIAIAQQFNANILNITWQGFGHAKNAVVAAAKNNWVLTLDADEVPTPALIAELKGLPLKNNKQLFIVKFKNYIGNKKLVYGDWTNVQKVRLFNKQFTRWENKPIHESVIRPSGFETVTLKNNLNHYCHKDVIDYATKMTYYGNEMATRYHTENKKASFFKKFVYPFFLFLYNFIFRLGFLDGSIGFVAAYMSAFYVFIKYNRLQELNNLKNKNKHESTIN